MTTSNEHTDLPAQAELADMSLQSDTAKAMVEEIKADNVALKEADRAAEAQAEAVVEQANRLAEVVEEVLEELKETTSGKDA
jgi:endonuclease/exonuclease/phosphatase family metal-dependent hydrolase